VVAAGEEVGAAHGGRRSWAARRAWRHHRHHHLHVSAISSPSLWLPPPFSSAILV
jgi:hypothetical protein